MTIEMTLKKIKAIPDFGTKYQKFIILILFPVLFYHTVFMVRIISLLIKIMDEFTVGADRYVYKDLTG